MRLTLTQARSRLGELCALAQDPRQPIVLTRHGRPLAALVSMAEVKRIWDLEGDARLGMRHILSGSRITRIPGLEMGVDGNLVTPREAALQVRERQWTRAEERRILEAGGVEGIEGGEIGEGAPERRRGVWGWVFG